MLALLATLSLGNHNVGYLCSPQAIGGLIQGPLLSVNIPNQVIPSTVPLNCAAQMNDLFTAFQNLTISSPFLNTSTGQPLFTPFGAGVYSYCIANLPYDNVKSLGCSPSGEALVIEDWCSFRPLYSLSTDFDECVAKSGGDICTLESGCGTQPLVEGTIQEVLCTSSSLLDVTEAGYSLPQRDMLFGAPQGVLAPPFLCRDIVADSPPRLS